MTASYGKRAYHSGSYTRSTNSSSSAANSVCLSHVETFSDALGFIVPPQVLVSQNPDVWNPGLGPSGFYQLFWGPVNPVYQLNAGGAFNRLYGAQAAKPSVVKAPWAWLQSVAIAFEEYHFRALKFTYLPMCSNTTQGAIILAYCPDSSALANDYNDYQKLMTLTSVSGALWSPITLDISIKGTEMPTGFKTVADRQIVNLSGSGLPGMLRGGFQSIWSGFFIVAVNGIASSMVNVLAPMGVGNQSNVPLSLKLGQIRTEYICDLRSPVINMQAVVGPSGLTACSRQFGYDATSAPLSAVYPIAAPGNVLVDSVVSDLGGLTVGLDSYTGPAGLSQALNFPQGKFVVNLDVTGTALTTIAIVAAQSGNGVTVEHLYQTVNATATRLMANLVINVAMPDNYILYPGSVLFTLATGSDLTHSATTVTVISEGIVSV